MKNQKLTIASLLIASVMMTACGEKEATTYTEGKAATTDSAVVAPAAIIYSTFENPELAFTKSVLTQKEFTVEEIRLAGQLPLGNCTFVGLSTGDTDPIVYSSKQGKIASEDGSMTMTLSRDYNKEEVSIAKGKLVAVTGTTQASYNTVYDNLNENVWLNIHSAEIKEIDMSEIVHVNDVKNIDPSKPMLIEEVKKVLGDYYAAIVANSPITVSGVVKSVMHSGLKNDDGSFKDAQITIAGAEKDYFTIIVELKEGVPSEKVINDLIKSKQVVSFSGDYDGGGLKNAKMN